MNVCQRCHNSGLTRDDEKSLGWCFCEAGWASYRKALDIALADVVYFRRRRADLKAGAL